MKVNQLEIDVRIITYNSTSDIRDYQTKTLCLVRRRH